MDIAAFHARWLGNEGGERANKDPFLLDLCDLLGVPRPDPATGDPEKDAYVYEKPAVLLHAAGKPTIGKIDLFRHGRFLLAPAKPAAPLAWPKALPERIGAVRDLMARATSPRSLAAVTASFAKAKPKDVEAVLESLASLGLLISFDGPEARVWQGGSGRSA